MHNGGVPEEIEREERLRVSAAAACRHLAAWWELNARDLPWRFGRTTPWGVLVSEVMSQQTQMSRVVPYWESWMAVWPDAAALAVASTAEVITAWGTAWLSAAGVAVAGVRPCGGRGIRQRAAPYV